MPKKITDAMTIREVMSEYPQTRRVFDKYGLAHCGGPKGPVESIAFFTKVHSVDRGKLLEELNQVVEGGAIEEEKESADEEPQAEEALYKPFLKASIVLVLTGGCVLGAVALTLLAIKGSFDYDWHFWRAMVQAHGHVQFYGWVGLFIMGIAYHVFPRLKATDLRGRELVGVSFVLMLVGIVVKSVSQVFAENAIAANIMVLASAVELIAVSLFLYVGFSTIKSSELKEYFDKYIVASLVWFWLAAALNVVISIYLSAKGTNVIPGFIDPPYLHIQAMGFIGMMILGISLKTLPLFLGLKFPNQKLSDISFWGLNTGIVMLAISQWFKGLYPSNILDGLFGFAAALEFICAILFVHNLNIFRKREREIEKQGFEKFIPVSYAWFAIAVVMFAVLGIYEAFTGNSAGHALIGSYRHAITVGFISMMIFGMAARMIPTFRGVQLHSIGQLNATFALINIGNALRVVFQGLTFALGAFSFAVMGVSGWLEVTAMALFGYNLWKTMNKTVDIEEEPGIRNDKAVDIREEGLEIEERVEEPLRVAEFQPEPPFAETATAETVMNGELEITASTTVGAVLDKYPHALNFFLSRGFQHLRDPGMRKQIGPRVTLGMACNAHGFDLAEFIAELKEAVS
ncbi:MAG: DUF1858 domain-containing protein [Candidatus Poribacteria bacterium]